MPRPASQLCPVSFVPSFSDPESPAWVFLPQLFIMRKATVPTPPVVFGAKRPSPCCLPFFREQIVEIRSKYLTVVTAL